MNTYKVVTNWKTLEQFVKDNLTQYKTDISFFHGPEETFVRSLSDTPLDILRKDFELKPCAFDEASAIIDDKYRNYGYFGEASLFSS